MIKVIDIFVYVIFNYRKGGNMKKSISKYISQIVVLMLLMTSLFSVNASFADTVDGSAMVDDTLNKTYEGGITKAGKTVDHRGFKIPLSADFNTEVFDNGDGTFSYYVIRNTTRKQPDFMNNTPSVVKPDMKPGHLLYADNGDFTMNYLPMQDKEKFQDVTLWANPEVEVISASVVDSNNNDTSTVAIETKGTQQIVKWNASQSNDTKVRFLNDPTNPFFAWVDIPPLQTIKVVVKPKANFTGSILPFKSVTGTGIMYPIQGSTVRSEVVNDHAFIRGFVVKNQVKPTITTTFYDKNFTKEVEEIKSQETVGVKYVIGNPSNVDVINFVQNLELENVTIDGVASTDIVKDKAFDLTGLMGKKTIVVQGTLVANADTEAVGTVKTTDKMVTNVAPATHILGSDVDNGIGNADRLGNKKYFRYRPENKIDSDLVFPALEGAKIDIEKSPFFGDWLYGYVDRSENGYKPGIKAFDTDYIYNGTNTVTDKELIATANDTLKVLLTTRWVEQGNETHKFKDELNAKDFGAEQKVFTENGVVYELVDTVMSADGKTKTYEYLRKAMPIVPAIKKLVKTRWIEQGNETHKFKDELSAKDFGAEEKSFTENGVVYELVNTVMSADGKTKTYEYLRKAMPLKPAKNKVKKTVKPAKTTPSKTIIVKEEKLPETGDTQNGLLSYISLIGLSSLLLILIGKRKKSN